MPSLEDTMETLKNENWTRIALAVEDPANRSYVVTMAMLLCLGLTMCVPPHPAAAGSPPPHPPHRPSQPPRHPHKQPNTRNPPADLSFAHTASRTPHATHHTAARHTPHATRHTPHAARCVSPVLHRRHASIDVTSCHSARGPGLQAGNPATDDLAPRTVLLFFYLSRPPNVDPPPLSYTRALCLHVSLIHPGSLSPCLSHTLGLSVSLSLIHTGSLSPCLAVALSIYRSVSRLSDSESVPLSMSVSVCLCLSVSRSPRRPAPLSLSHTRALYLLRCACTPVCMCVCVLVYLSVLFLSLSICVRAISPVPPSAAFYLCLPGTGTSSSNCGCSSAGSSQCRSAFGCSRPTSSTPISAAATAR